MGIRDEHALNQIQHKLKLVLTSSTQTTLPAVLLAVACPSDKYAGYEAPPSLDNYGRAAALRPFGRLVC